MRERSGWWCGFLVEVLLLGFWTGVPTAVGAAVVVPECTATDPAPQVLDVQATYVVVRRELTRVPG